MPTVKPCRFGTEDENGKKVVMTYDQMRQYLYENPQLWENLGLRRKGRKAVSAGPVKVQRVIPVATFFSGAGTLEGALSGTTPVMAVEFNSEYMDAYNKAHGMNFTPMDVTVVKPEEIKKADPLLFHASPSCKSFSGAKMNDKGAQEMDMRSAESVAEAIRQAEPPVVTIENVPNYKDSEPYNKIIEALKEKGYTYDVGVYDAADYGGIQTRKRLIVRAVKDGKLPALPEKQAQKDWYEAIKDLIEDAPDDKFSARTKETNWEKERIDNMIAKGELSADKPIITMGGSASKGVPYARNSGGPSPTLTSTSNAVPRIILPDGRVKRVTPEMMRRIMSLPESFSLPTKPATAKEVLGNGIDGAITKAIIQPLINSQVEAKPSKKEADPVIRFLNSLKAEPGVIGMNAGLWNAVLEEIGKVWLASKSAAKAIQAGIDWLKSKNEDPSEYELYLDGVRAKMQEWEKQNASQKAEEKAEAPKPPKPPVTPPPMEGKGVPEGEEREVPKTAFMRGYEGATREEIRKKMEDIGLFRTPGSLEEAKQRADVFISTYGPEAALEAARNEAIDGLYKTYLYGAILADNLARQDSLRATQEEVEQLIVDYANISNEASQTLTIAGQQLRAWKDILESQTIPFSYDGIKKQWTEKFGEESWTKEREEQFQKLVNDYNAITAKYKKLEDEKAQWEAQDVVDAEKAQEKKERPASYLKEAAKRVRKLLTSRPGIFSSATPASLAWDASVEAVALALEAGGTLEVAIRKGIDKLRSTDWYKSLTASKKTQAEDEFSKSVKDGYISKATIDENGNIQIPSDLLRSYVESGITNVEDIINDVLSYLKQENDSITERDVRAAIINYGRRNNPTPNQKRDAVNRLKREMKLITNLEDIRNKIPLAKNPVNKRELSDREKQLEKMIEEAHIENFGYKPRGRTDAERLAAAKKNAQKAIDDLRNRTPRPERRPPVEYDQEMSRLLDEKFRLREEVQHEMAKEELERQTIAQKAGETALRILGLSRTVMVGIGDLGTLLIQGSVLPFRSGRVAMDAIKNLGKAFWSEQYYQNHINEIHKSDFYRMMKQSGLDVISPFDTNIRVEESGIDTLGESIVDTLFLKPLKLIPGIGPKVYEYAKRLNFVRVLNRSQSAYMNTLRVGNFLLSAQNLESKGITFQNNKEAYKDVADMINTLSGRTKLGSLENSNAVMTGLNLVFFSAKNWASILKMLTPYVFLHVGKRRAGAQGLEMSESQKVYAYTFLKWVATTSLLTLAIKALTDWNDEDEEEKKRLGNVSVDLENPTSSAFGKFRVGNQVFDPWGGKMQVILLQARILMHYLGKRAYYDPYTGAEKYLSETPFESLAGLMGRYVTGKLSPIASLLYKYASMTPVKGRPGYFQEVKGGKEVGLIEPLGEGFTNLTWSALNEVYGQQPLSIDAIATAFIIAGGGLTTLNDVEQASAISKIRDLLNPGEKETAKLMKSLSSYLKDGDTERATKVLDRATGVYAISKKRDILKGEGKFVGDLNKQIEKARKTSIKELYEGVKNDRVGMGYSVDKMYADELMDAAFNGKRLDTRNVSKRKAEAFNAINSIPEDLMVDVRERYDSQYDELMTVSKGLDNILGLNKVYEDKMKRIPWVKKYEKIKGIKK